MSRPVSPRPGVLATDDPRIPADLREWCAANGWSVDGPEMLAGGGVNTVVRLTDGDARSVVAKWARTAPTGLYAAEADGLRRLAATGTVRVPTAIAVSDGFLVLEDLGPVDADRTDWARLGDDLAGLHAVRSARFGADRDNFLGLLPQRNTWTVDGHEFFARHRILRYLEESLVAEALTADDRRRIDRLAERLPDFIPEQPASLVHGDLWSGNVVGNARGVFVIDPAPYFGWPEAELSMMWCSGRADARFFDAYLERHPFESGWQERMPILHLREHLSVLAHFGRRSGVLDPIRAVLARFT